MATMSMPAATVCAPYSRMFSFAILPRYNPSINSVVSVRMMEIM